MIEKRLFTPLVSLLVILTLLSLAPQVSAQQNDLNIRTLVERTRFRHKGAVTLEHICPVDRNRVVLFSRVFHPDMNGPERALAGSAVDMSGFNSLPKIHFTGFSGSYGALALDSVWPGKAQKNVVPYGLLFAFMRPVQYDGPPPILWMSPFNRLGWPVRTRVKLLEMDDLKPLERVWEDSVSVAACVQNDEIAVVVTYAIWNSRPQNAADKFKAVAQFTRFDVYGQQVGTTRTIPLPRNGVNQTVKAFRPVMKNGNWYIPLTTRDMNLNVTVREYLRMYVLDSSGAFKDRIIDRSNIGTGAHDDFAYSAADFLEGTVSDKIMKLFIQRKAYGASNSNQLRRFDVDYLLATIGRGGNRTSPLKRLPIGQWSPDLAKGDRSVSRHREIATHPQWLGADQYLFAATRELAVITNDKYQFEETDYASSLYQFNAGSYTAVEKRTDLFPGGYYQRLSKDVRKDLVKREPRGDYVMASQLVDTGHSTDRKVWSEMLYLEQTADGSRPASRTDHALAYDHDDQQVLLFGGASGGTFYNDLWAAGDQGWFRLDSGNGPAPRARHAMAWDERSNRVIVYGGRDNSGAIFNDTWAWNDQTWEKLSNVKPNPLYGHSMVYSPSTRRVYLFGGENGFTFFNDLYYWAGRKWVRINPGPFKPSPRSEAAVAWSESLNGLVVYGGFDGERWLSDMYIWRVSSGWHQLREHRDEYSSPPAMSGAAIAEDPLRGQLLMVGGYQGADKRLDSPPYNMYRYPDQNSDWSTQYNESWLPARAGHAIIWDKKNNRLLLYGGWDGDEVVGDTWLWDGQDWRLRQP